MAGDAVAICRAWVKCINTQNIDGLEALAADDHVFFVDGEARSVGKDRIRPSWTGYFASLPDYVVYEDELFDRPDAVYLIGNTTGSHVPAELERVPSCVIWRCVVIDGHISEWSIYSGNKENRERFGLPG